MTNNGNQFVATRLLRLTDIFDMQALAKRTEDSAFGEGVMGEVTSMQGNFYAIITERSG